ncbi:MAG: nitroreductase family protein [Desulfobacterales bacterium]|nr:nitroreductase family protein [Desulfobacterales bacterium]MBL7102665.1 nitroreductase family protein [Desulfobacteraceae bacterium]
MNVSDAILKRVSIRKWKSAPVEKEKIEKVLEAGRRAPSWGNTQPWRFIVVQDKAKKEELAGAAGGQPVVADAPVVIVCCGMIEVFSRKMQRQSLKQLMDVGALAWTDDILDNVVLESDLFAPYRLGEQIMTIKAGEQIMIAIAYMTLEAVNQGLGTCWVGAMSAKDTHQVMNLPDSMFVHDLLPLGYPDEDPKPRPRKPLKQLYFWEKYES